MCLAGANEDIAIFLCLGVLWVFFFSRTRNQKGGGKGDETEEWATAGLVSVRTLNFDWLEAWPAAF